MSRIDPVDPEPVLEEPSSPSKSELLREDIMKESDAVQILIRPLNNNVNSVFTEEIIESASLNKKVRTIYHYRSGPIAGRPVQLSDGQTVEEII